MGRYNSHGLVDVGVMLVVWVGPSVRVGDGNSVGLSVGVDVSVAVSVGV